MCRGAGVAAHCWGQGATPIGRLRAAAIIGSRAKRLAQVIEGKSRDEIRAEEQAHWEEMTIEEHMEYYESQGIDRKEAMKRVAKDRGIGKRDVYKALL